MNKTNLVKKLIADTGLNMKNFSEKAGIPYTTLRSMLERGIENASVNNVIKVCNALDICVESLYEICRKEESTSLSQDETILLESYRKLNDLGKKEAVKRISELTEISKYINQPENEYYTLAAHDDGIDKETAKNNLEKAKAIFAEMDNE